MLDTVLPLLTRFFSPFRIAPRVLCCLPAPLDMLHLWRHSLTCPVVQPWTLELPNLETPLDFSFLLPPHIEFVHHSC